MGNTDCTRKEIDLKRYLENRVQNPRITGDFAPIFKVMQKIISINMGIRSNMSPVTSKKGFLAH